MENVLNTNNPAQASDAALQRAIPLSDEKYRAAFECTGTGMLIIEDDMTILAANDRICEATGYTRDEIVGKVKWSLFVADEDLQRLMQYHQLRLTSQESIPKQYEFKYRHKSGAVMHALITASLIPGTKQRLISMMDITEQKRTEQTARENEKKYRDLFENANDIVYVHALDGFFSSVNKVALTTYGYTKEEVGSINISSIIDRNYLGIAQERLIERVKRHLLSEPTELLTYKKTGEPVWIEVRTSLVLQDGQGIGIQGIARDITERKKIEEQLIESQRRFKETADLLPSMIVEVDTRGYCTYVNKIGLQKFGYGDEDLKKGFWVEDVFAPYEVERVRKNIGTVLAGMPSKLEEYIMVHKNGTQGTYYITSAIKQRDGKVEGLRSCIVDVTEKKHMEQQIHRKEEQFRSIYTASPIGIALFNDSGRFMDANGSFRRMFGLSDAIDYAAVVFSLFEDVPDVKMHQKDLIVGLSVSFESPHDFTFTQDNGRYTCVSCNDRYLEWHVTPLGIPREDKQMFLAQVQDITEKKRAQEVKLSTVQKEADKANKMVEGLRKEILSRSQFQNMISRSTKMQGIFTILPEIAQAATTVLITGDSGTGKELIARSIHALSPRKDKPFVAINCGALPDNLLESELFGYKAGAFTDAKKDKLGKFALADGGTIFLDEIGDVSPAMQVKLLRVLQERVFEPLGATGSTAVDVRVIAATNRDLPELIKNGQFREDLYYRIKVLKLTLPPLRERKCDIPLLCDHFISLFNARFKKSVAEVSTKALDVMLTHDYPGNIRELENILEHAFIFCKGASIEVEHLPEELSGITVRKETSNDVFDSITSFDELEKRFLSHIIKQSGGSKVKAAEKLGVHKATLFRKIKMLGIDDEKN